MARIVGYWRGQPVIDRPGVRLRSSWPPGMRAYWRQHGRAWWEWPRAFTRPQLLHCGWFWALTWLWGSIYIVYRHMTLAEWEARCWPPEDEEEEN